jgi:hypothetical protein
MPRGVRTFAAYLAVGGTALLSLAALNLAADHFPHSRGLNELRDYLVNRPH